jgi:hypothetical protein
MLKTILVALLSFSIFFSSGTAVLAVENNQSTTKSNPVTIEKMIVAGGDIAMNVNMDQLNGGKRAGVLRFNAAQNSPLTVIVTNNYLRGPLPSSMRITTPNPFELPVKMNASAGNLVVEVLPFGNHYELAVRDGNTGYTFFYIEGHQYNYNASTRQFTISEGRLILSNEYANDLGRVADAGAIVGEFASSMTMKTIDTLIDGKSETDYLVENSGEILSGTDAFTRFFNSTSQCGANAGTVPGPDVVVGDLMGLAQFGSAVGTQVGLAVGTDSCNYGTIDLNWFANPANDHPVIPQALYRQSGGTSNSERFEQIGQGQVKHAFTALTQNLCGLGCNGVGGSRLGSGCSDPYSASLNSGPNLGSKAWINPFTGEYPRNDSATPNNSHTGHTHVGTSHRILVERDNLNTTLNPGATYFAEAQYVTPHEYAWCQTNPTQCNMYNNVSYRQYNVVGTTGTFTFSAAGSTQRQKPAIYAWTGASVNEFRPAPGQDGAAFIAYKVTQTSANVWHYEYAVYNQSLDRAIQSLSIPVGTGVTLSNVGFYAPPQHPGSTADGTAGNTGFSNAPWTPAQGSSAITWSSESLAQNPNANAIRWSTMYNFRFDSNRPPQTGNATIGFFKTGEPITVQVQVPSGPAAMVTVSGRVMTSTGQGVNNAVVSLVDSGSGGRLFARTNSFGYYTITDVPSGVMYTGSVQSRGFYTFNSQNVAVNDNITDLNFVALP